MKNEEKLDLLKDLCSRLPFGVNIVGKKISSCLHAVKPFLLPLSSMIETSLGEDDKGIALDATGLNLY